MTHCTRISCLLALAVGCAAPASNDMPLPSGVGVTVEQELVLEDDVRVPSDDRNLLGVELEPDGRLRFRYASAPEIDFQVGEVIVGNEGRGYQGRVLEIAMDGNDRLVSFEPVGLDEVLALA